MRHAYTTLTAADGGFRRRVSSLGTSILSSRQNSDRDFDPSDTVGPRKGEKMQTSFSWRVVHRGRRMFGRGASKTCKKMGLTVEEIAKLASQRSEYERARTDDAETERSEDERTLADLIDAGYTIDEISHAIYDKLCTFEEESGMDSLNFFPHVRLDTLGGLGSVEKLWYPTRPLWALLVLGQCIANIALLLSLNRSIFQVAWYEAVRGANEVASHAPSIRDLVKGIADKRLDGSSMDPLATNDDEQFLTFASEWDARRRFVDVASFIALLEVLGLFYLIARVVQLILRFAMNGGMNTKSEYKAYFAMDSLVRSVVPMMSTFSALKLGVRVHPLLAYNDYIHMVRVVTCCGKPLGRSPVGVALITIAFVLMRLAYLAIGLSAFCVKVAVVGAKLTHPRLCSWWRSGAEAFALLNNCINAVPMEKQLQDRIFLFIFGGEDSDYQDDERALLYVYRCWVIKAVWREYWVNQGERLKAIVVLITLDHYDLQTLLLEKSDTTILSYCEVSPEAVGTLASQMDFGDIEAPAMAEERQPVAPPALLPEAPAVERATREEVRGVTFGAELDL